MDSACSRPDCRLHAVNGKWQAGANDVTLGVADVDMLLRIDRQYGKDYLDAYQKAYCEGRTGEICQRNSTFEHRISFAIIVSASG